MVAGSAINRSVSVSNPIASIKTQKDICKTRLLAGKAWPRLLRYFFKVGVEHCVAYLCVGLLHSTSKLFIVKPLLLCCGKVQERKTVKDICYSRLHLFLFIGFLVDGPPKKKQKYS